MTARKTATAVLLLAAAASTASAGIEDWFKPKPKPDTSGGAKDGNFTILLYLCRGDGMPHTEQAKLYKANTEKYAGWENLFIVHKEDHSLLFWGKYARLDDAQPNLKKAKEYLTPAKIKVYAKAIVVPLPGKEDVGPPEWNLDNTDPNYVYTVLVAEFHDVPEQDYVGRRDFAVQYCKQLRGEGRLAFYRHSEIESVVTVGLFKKSAITDTPKDGKIIRTINDSGITKLLQQFPKLAVNGCEELVPAAAPKTVNDVDPKTGRVIVKVIVDSKTGKMVKVATPSYLTIIPRENSQNASTTRPSPGNNLGHPEPGKTPGDAAGTGGPAGEPAGPGSSRRD
jgi:hypothetical protein